MIDIKEHIPQREPFLYLDKVLEFSKDNKIKTETFITPELEFFKGHFPGNPITPGVILCEAAFQSGALLGSLMSDSEEKKQVVVSRIQSAKFRNIVRPNDSLIIETELLETLGNASFFNSTLKVLDKTVLNIKFSCAYI